MGESKGCEGRDGLRLNSNGFEHSEEKSVVDWPFKWNIKNKHMIAKWINSFMLSYSILEIINLIDIKKKSYFNI